MVTEYGQRLRQARILAKLTQEQAAKKTGIPQSTISTAERLGNGSSETPVYAKVYGVDAHWLATGEGDMQPTGARLTAPSFQVSASGGPSPNEITVGMALDVLATAIAASDNKASDSLVGTLASFAKDPRNPIHKEILELLLTKQVAPESSKAA